MAARVLISAQSTVGAYPVTPITADAADLAETAGDATNGHYTPIVDGKTCLQFHNTGAGARTATITSAADPTFHRLGTITAYSLGAGEISKLFGPFSKAGWANVGPDVALSNPSAATDDIIDTATAHGFALHDVVRFTALTGGTGLVIDTDYFVVSASLAAQTFRVAASRGGSPINFTTDITAGTVVRVGVAAATPEYLWIDESHAEMKVAVIQLP